MLEVTVTFTPTRADLMAISYLGVRSRPIVYRSALAFFVVLPWLVGAGLLIGRALGASTDWTSIGVLIAVPPLMIAFFAVLPIWQSRGALTLRGTHHYRFAEAGIHLEGPGFRNDLGWEILTTCVVSRMGLLFNSGRVPIVAVPARVLEEGTKAALLSLASAHKIALRPV